MGIITKVLADNLRRMRKERNLTQTQLADAIGISLASIQGYEAERVWPAMDTIKALAKKFGVDESDLFTDIARFSQVLYAQSLIPLADDIELKDIIRLLSHHDQEASKPRRKA